MTGSEGMVSVIVPFYNAEQFLEEAVDSIRVQRYSEWEILLIDDGSLDGSTRIALALVDRYPDRIRYLAHEGHQNRGAAASRNLGFDLARGEYLAMLDADDLWEPQFLEEAVPFLSENPSLGMVYGTSLMWYSWNPGLERPDSIAGLGIPDRTLSSPPSLIAGFLRWEAIPPCTCSVLMRRSSVLEAGGGDESFPYRFDDTTLLYALALKFPVLAIDRCWSKYRQNRESLNNSTAPVVAETERLRFLEWLEEFLRRHEVTEPVLWKMIREELSHYRRPLLHQARAYAQPIADRMRQWPRSLSRRIRGRSTGTIVARPNPVPVAGLATEGVSELSWSARGTKTVEVRVQGPDGPVFSQTIADGGKKSADWIMDGMTFFLQEAAAGGASKPDALLSTVRVRVVAPRRDYRPRYRPWRISTDRYDTEFRSTGMDRFLIGSSQRRNEALAEWIRAVRPARVFEFAAGGAGLARLAEDSVGEYLWSDFAEVPVAAAGALLRKAAVRRIDICDEYRSFPWGRYDAVVCVSPGDIPDDLVILTEVAPGTRVFLSCAMADDSPFTRTFPGPDAVRQRFSGLLDIVRMETVADQILVEARRRDRCQEERELRRMFHLKQHFDLRKQQNIHRYVADQLSGRVLELGCKDGYLFPYLQCERYLGVDPCAEAVEQARKQYHAEFRVGDWAEPPGSGPFDSLYFNGVLWTRADKVAAIRRFDPLQPRRIVVQELEETRIELPYRLRAEKRFRLVGGPERFRKRVVRVFDVQS